jgi:hypothetical protein
MLGIIPTVTVTDRGEPMTAARRLTIASCVIAAIGSIGVTTLGSAASAAPAHVHAASAGSHVRGDLDGDGKRDIVVGAPGGDRVRVAYTHAKPGGSHVRWLTPPEASFDASFYGGTLAVGNFNGDGFADLAVGAPGWTNPMTVGNNRETQGALYLYDGSKTGLHYTGHRVHGPYDGEDPFSLGSLAATADINRDGFADLAFKIDNKETKQIEVVYGRHSGLRLNHPQFFDDFGAASMACGDVNGDGFPDLALGDDTDLANTHDVFQGAVQMIYGSSSGLRKLHRQKISGARLGTRIGLGEAIAVGDINHDGFGDVVVGDPAASKPSHPSPGKIVVLPGNSHGISAKRHRTIDEKANHLSKHTGVHDLFGWSISISPINGDKFPDVLVGAPGVRVSGKRNAGAAYVLRGTKHGVTTKHVHRLTQASPHLPGNPQQNAQFGNTVQLVALNHDAFSDALIAAPGGSYGATHGGFVAVLRSGSHGLTTKHAKSFADTTANDRLGTAIAG